MSVGGLQRQPASLPGPDDVAAIERPPTADERDRWRRLQRSEARTIVFFGTLMAAFVAMMIGGLAAAATFLFDEGLAGTVGLVVGAPVLLVGVVKLARALLRRRRERREDLLRVLDLRLADVRAWHVDDGDKCEGWLFVLDRERSVFVYGQCIWLPPMPDHDDPDAVENDEDVAPTSLHLVLGSGRDGELYKLRQEEQGPLRLIGDLDDGDAVQIAERTANARFGTLVHLVPTPPSAGGAA